MSRTYGQLVKEGAIPPQDEEGVRRLYGLVPLNGETTTESKIRGHIPEPEREHVPRYVDLLKNGGLVSTGKGRSRTISRSLRKYPRSSTYTRTCGQRSGREGRTNRPMTTSSRIASARCLRLTARSVVVGTHPTSRSLEGRRCPSFRASSLMS